MALTSNERRRRMQNRFAKNLTYLMVYNGKTIKELADKLMIAERTMQKKMAEPWKFSVEECMTMAILFNVDLDFLFGAEIVFEKKKVVYDLPCAGQ